MWKILWGKRFWVKIILVKGKTSLQTHKERDEIHFGVSFVRRNQKHRLLPGIYLEIATGEPREEDITRFEDDYNRA